MQAAGALAVTAAAIGLGGCASSTSDSVAVRVGGVAITGARVERWTAALAGGRDPSGQSTRRALRRQALESLIVTQWLLGEAARQGLRLSPAEVSQQLAQKKRAAFPGGAGEQSEFFKATGETVADVELEAKAELAKAKIRQALAQREAAVTQAQIVSYYEHHKQAFLIPEHRVMDIIALQSPADAQTLRREVAAGKSFASVAERQSIELTPAALSASRGKDAILARAIHFAKPHVLTGPVRFRGFDYYMFEVLSVTPAVQKTLAQVQGSIAHKLAEEQQQRTLATFIAAWRSRWIPRTDCASGYVVQKCRQYDGPRDPEEPLAFD